MACAVHGQPTFQKIYQSGTSYTLDLIELPGHNILTALGGTLLLNPQGYVEHASGFFGGGTYFVQTLTPARINEFYFTTGMNLGPCSGSSATLIDPVIGKMDSLGSTLIMRKYELNTGICYGPPSGLAVTSNMGAVVWGRDRNFFAMKVDSALEPVWSKRIMHRGGFQFVKELPGGDLLVGINMDTAGVVVARLDADGNFLWCKSYLRPRGIIHDALIESDDSFIITGYTDSTSLLFTQTLPSTFQPKLFMLRLNGVGEVQWCRGWFNSTYRWSSGRPSRVEKTLDGNYAVLATLGFPENNYYYRPFLMKTDLNGDTLWTRSVGRNGYAYMARDLLTYSDGGYMFSGIVEGSLPGGNTGLCYIIKTDSLGHFNCYEQHFPVQALDLFPVDSSLTLSVVDGVATMATVLVNDSIVDPSLFIEYDACTFATSIPTMVRQPQKMKIYPNPNTGRFTVEFADPLMAESYYSVYDVMGKLLYQRPLPPGTTLEEVDLARFGTGTYVIKCTDPDGVSYERVVVE